MWFSREKMGKAIRKETRKKRWRERKGRMRKRGGRKWIRGTREPLGEPLHL